MLVFIYPVLFSLAGAPSFRTRAQVANFLCNGNYAVSGSSKACDVVEQIAKPDFKARMTVRLAVAGAFHTDFMEAAVDKVRGTLLAVAVPVATDGIRPNVFQFIFGPVMLVTSVFLSVGVVPSLVWE